MARVYLGPEIVRALLAGSQSNALTPSRLLRLSKNLPHDWEEQRCFLGFACNALVARGTSTGTTGAETISVMFVAFDRIDPRLRKSVCFNNEHDLRRALDFADARLTRLILLVPIGARSQQTFGAEWPLSLARSVSLCSGSGCRCGFRCAPPANEIGFRCARSFPVS